MTIQAAASARSDVGKSRSTNEDYFAIRPDAGLYLVADGMGGHGNGEVASKLASLSVCKTIETLDGKYRSGASAARGAAESLRTALEEANQAVFRAVDEDRELEGMGATMVAMALRGGNAVIAHVGDSRAYRYREGRLEQLTEDHTWVGQQVSAGELSKEDARSHPFRNVVTRALGGEEALTVDLADHQVSGGDLFLLCTDGLTGVLEDADIAEILEGSEDLDRLCAALIDAANDAGGPDNITVLLVRFNDSQAG